MKITPLQNKKTADGRFFFTVCRMWHAAKVTQRNDAKADERLRGVVLVGSRGKVGGCNPNNLRVEPSIGIGDSDSDRVLDGKRGSSLIRCVDIRLFFRQTHGRNE